MNSKRHIGYMTVAAALLAATACTDFNDYNEAVEDATPQGGRTLWENIAADGSISQFKSLVEKAGFADELKAAHYRTVWAPRDGSYDYAAMSQLSAADLKKQFVLNHIADYSHNATGTLTEKDEANSKVKMLNDKVYPFLGSAGSYTFGGNSITLANQPSSNGVLHIMDGQAAYHPNLYELLTDSTQYATLGIDSMASLVKRYEAIYLDENASVVGPIVDGRQTYIDSVMVTENLLTYMLNTDFVNEDSSYTMLIPTDEAWQKSYEKILPNYNFLATTKATVWQNNNGTMQEVEKTYTIDNPAYLTDSIVKMGLISGLVFSNNNGYNRWLTGEPSYLGRDTLRSTIGSKYSNPTQLLAAAKGEAIPLSNGQAYVMDSLAYLPWENYSPKLTESATANVAMLTQGVENAQRVNLANVPDSILEGIDTRNLTSLNYLYVEPDVEANLPSANFYLPNVRSTTYDIYCVFMPTCLDDTVNTPKPNLLKFDLNYYDAAGAKKTYSFKTTERTYAGKDYPFETTVGVDSFYVNPNRIDSLYLGTVTFPVCYYDLQDNGTNICPNILVSTGYRRTEYWDRDLGIRKRDHYAHGFRIASFVLKPKELVEHENPVIPDENE